MKKISLLILSTLFFICFGCGCLHSEPQIQQESAFQGTVLDPSLNNLLESKHQLTLLPFYDAGNNKHFVSSDSLKVALTSPYDTIIRHYAATTSAMKLINLDGEGAYSITVTSDTPEDAVEVSWIYWFKSETADKFGNIEYQTSSFSPPQSRCIVNKYLDCKTTLVFKSGPYSQDVPDHVDIFIRGFGTGTIEVTKIPFT